MVEIKAPAPVVIIVALMVAPMASLGWYAASGSGSEVAMVARRGS